MAHYFAEKPSAALRLQKILIKWKGQSYEFFSGNEVFSKTRFDPGSKVLLDSVIDQAAKQVLDLGCGIGIVGILFKKFHPHAAVFLSDINPHAVLLAKKNARLQNVEVTAKQGSIFVPWTGLKFDLILLNPPQQAGRELSYQMIEESAHYLGQGGMLAVVARHNKGGKMLKEKMKAVFGNVEDIGKQGIYKVYKANYKPKTI